MNAIERLKRDHKILRAKLDVLEGGLRMGPEAWFVLREVSHTLARQLRDHIRREERLVAACRQVMATHTVEQMTVEHRDEPERLRILSRLFLADGAHTLEEVKPMLTDVIDGLRHHMAEEEREFFPVLERVLAGHEVAMQPAASPGPAGFEEVMTVNRIIQQFPRTKPVFERLFVNIPYEGCDCLDEVAWRHGMESRELLEKLERAAGRTSTTEDAEKSEAVPCGCTHG